LRIGVTAGASAFFLPRALGAFSDQWPGIEIEVVEGIWDDLSGALTDYQVDLVLAPEAEESEHIVAAKNCQWRESMSVIVGNNHALLGKQGICMKDLNSARWCFVPKSTEPHKRLISLFEKKGLTPPAMAVTSASIPLLKSLVAHSGFISWLTAPMYAAELTAGMLHELSVDGLDHPRSFLVYHRREGILPKLAVRFIDELRRLTTGSVDASSASS